MNSITTNLNNWTGKEATVDFTDELEFNFQGYAWKVTAVSLEDQGFALHLNGDDWYDELTVLYTEINDVEDWIKRAVIWIANHV